MRQRSFFRTPGVTICRDPGLVKPAIYSRNPYMNEAASTNKELFFAED